MAYAFLIPIVLIAVAVFQLRNVGRRPKDYPPGPPTLPLIGNLHQMPSKGSHHQFKKWAKEYGYARPNNGMTGSSSRRALTA